MEETLHSDDRLYFQMFFQVIASPVELQYINLKNKYLYETNFALQFHKR